VSRGHDVNCLFQIDFYSNRFLGTELRNPSFAEISRSMGAEGVRVTEPHEIRPALDALVASGRPAVLEIIVNKDLADPFRRDALKVPVRRLEKYNKFQ
jgi:sulfoacetaldehyde acetyltransferase